MPFRKKVAEDALVACARRCCICRKFSGKKMQLHHIVPEAAGGEDSLENCIPLCLNCHEEVGSYNSDHPIGKKFGNDELRRHRDLWFDFVLNHPERLSFSDTQLFHPTSTDRAQIYASVEPHYHEVTIWSKDQGSHKKEVFSAKVRNQGIRSIFVDEIGFVCGERKYLGVFTPYSSKTHGEASEIPPGHSQVFSFFGVKIEETDVPKIDGMYLVTGSGNLFVNTSDSLERLIKQFQNEQS
jgi:hypothetical protein